jgi:hypothetical protein
MLCAIMPRCSHHGVAALLLGALILLPAPRVGAAVGCALSDPEADLRGFFPEMTDFSTHYLTFQAQAPDRHKLLAKGIGGSLDPVYETPDVPYTLYGVRARGEVLGYVFGANQRGTYSNIQVIAVTDAGLDLQRVYLQKIRSPVWEAFRSAAFSEALSKLSLADYPDLRRCYLHGRCDDVAVADPAGGKDPEDYRAILRALAKLHVLSQVLLEPGVDRAGRDDKARSERISSWWTGVPMGAAIDAPRWSTTSEAPWTDEEPVWVWRGTGGGVILPVAVLALHRVLNATVGGRELAFTWSPRGGTAIALERPRGTRFQPTGELLHGVALVASSRDRSQWSPALGVAVRGVSSGEVTRLAAGPVITSYRQARRVAPDARVLLGASRDEVATLRSVREKLAALQDPRTVAVVAVGDGRHAFETEGSPEGLARTRLAGRNVALLHVGALRSAFAESQPGALVYLGRSPFSGLPQLWDRTSGCLHEGVTGAVLHGPDQSSPLEPVAVYAMAQGPYSALHPGAPITTLGESARRPSSSAGRTPDAHEGPGRGRP